MKRTIILLMAVVAISLQAMAGVTVENVSVRQHWPWNGLVDIDYEIVSDDAEATFLVYPKAEDKRLGKKLIMRTLSGGGADGPVKPGAYRMVWDAKADNPGFHSPDVAVSIQTVSAQAEYLVVDLSGGTNAVTFPVHFSPTGPDVANDRCRTSELWLRLVLPGTFQMGSPADELLRWSNEDLHEVTLTRPYYLGVFELTQTQWKLVMGTTNVFNYLGPCRPVDNVTFSEVRGVSANGYDDDIAAESFFGVLRSKTGMAFDLPTESQWEYACRAGTTGAWNNGTTTMNGTFGTSGSGASLSIPGDSNLAKLGRCNKNQSDGQESYTQHTKVGLYQANAWGFYDMHGNVWEWCRDAYRAQWGSLALLDPVGGDGDSSRVLRGGSFACYPTRCRSASRESWTGTSISGDMANGYTLLGVYNSYRFHLSSAIGQFGFRVGCFPVE